VFESLQSWVVSNGSGNIVTWLTTWTHTEDSLVVRDYVSVCHTEDNTHHALDTTHTDLYGDTLSASATFCCNYNRRRSAMAPFKIQHSSHMADDWMGGR